jgi:23S rRNA (uracil1939-C5)-methyltransferase
LKRRYTEVMACEAYPESAAALGIAPQTAEGFLTTALERALTPELIIANPPRAGLGPLVCGLLVQMAANAPFRLHVMSCEPRAMARDLAALGGWSVESATAYDTLPQTAHVEIVMRLRANAVEGPTKKT